MTLTLPPELEAGIERELATGRFETPFAVMAAALEALADSTPADIEHLDADLQESMDAADRGELFDEAAVRAHLKAVRTKL